MTRRRYTSLADYLEHGPETQEELAARVARAAGEDQREENDEQHGEDHAPVGPLVKSREFDRYPSGKPNYCAVVWSGCKYLITGLIVVSGVGIEPTLIHS